MSQSPPILSSQNHIDPLRRVHYLTRVTDPSDASDSPYRAPVAALDRANSDNVISEQALHSLISSKLWMRIAGVALMVNGVMVAVAAFWIRWVSSTERGVLPGSQLPLLTILLLLAGFRIFHPGLRLMQASLAVSRAALSREERDIAFALRRHQEFWKSLGIAFVLILLIFFLYLTVMSRYTS